MNKNFELREKIIYGDHIPTKYFGGCRNFSCTREVIQELLENDFIDPKECQNDSPSVQEFFDFTEGFDDVEFECYEISPDRDDYRVTIEGIDISIPDNDHDGLSNVVDYLRYADEFDMTHTGSKYFIHAWWD